jgi:hypothetical protein
MTLDLSTINVLLGLAIAGQCWIFKQLMSLGNRITRLEALLGIRNSDTERYWRKRRESEGNPHKR